MSNLEHLLLPVTMNNWNSYTYSPRVSTLISFSSDAGAIPEALAYVPVPPSFIFDKFNQPVDHQQLITECKAIDGDDDLELSLQTMLSKYRDIENEPLLDSNFKYTLPHAFKHSKGKTTSLTMVYPSYLQKGWAGLLEQKTTNRFDPDVICVTFKSNLADIDLMLNQHISVPINLLQSDSYLHDIIKEIANRHNEKIDIENALMYFLNQPFRLLILAVEKGIQCIIEDGYNEYSTQLAASRFITVDTKNDTNLVNMQRIFDHRFDEAGDAYDIMCGRLDIQPAWELFENHFTYMQQGCNTEIDSVVNTITRLSTGYDFTIRNWNYFQQAVFDLAMVQMGNDDSSKIFEEWINSRR